jgi:hypothetical protein
VGSKKPQTFHPHFHFFEFRPVFIRVTTWVTKNKYWLAVSVVMAVWVQMINFSRWSLKVAWSLARAAGTAWPFQLPSHFKLCTSLSSQVGQLGDQGRSSRLWALASVIFTNLDHGPDPEFLNFKGAQESILRNRFRQPICSLAGGYDKPFPLGF